MTSLHHAERDPHDQNPLAAYVEDRLDDQEKEGLIEHLADCRECRRTLAALARGADLLPGASARPSVGSASYPR
jgi:anti-sigma factor RsiW